MSSVFSNSDNKQSQIGQGEELTTNIKVNPNTNNAQLAWEMLRVKVDKKEVERLSLNTPIYDNKVCFTVCLIYCISFVYAPNRT
jgi:hypothetical protein